MKPLKTNVITFRTDDNTKALIDQMAKEKEWSIAQVVEKIVKVYFEEKGNTNENP